MRGSLKILALCAPLVLASAAHAERHYDCTKPGNAKKAACKTAPVATTAAMSTAPNATAATSATTSERHFDCTKAGNKNKAACKSVAAPPPPTSPKAAVTAPAPKPSPAPVAVTRPAPVAPSAPATAGAPRIVAWTEKNGKVVHYDCSKRGNFSRQACKAP